MVEGERECVKVKLLLDLEVFEVVDDAVDEGQKGPKDGRNKSHI